MPDVQPTPPTSHPAGGHSLKGVLTNDLAGMPTWVWLVVIAAGIGAAYIIPRFINGKNTGGNAPTTGTTPDSGLGLAIDPTTGLPYAVEGMVPAGGTVGTGSGSGNGGTPPPQTQGTCAPNFTFQAGTLGEPIPNGSYVVAGGYCVPNSTSNGGNGNGNGGKQPPPPPQPQEKFVHPTPWPTPDSTLSGIAAANGISLARIEQLNPWIFQQRGTWNLIYTSDSIRIA